MRHWIALFLTTLLLACLGCGASDKDRGINSNKDRPRSTAE
jgi:hypothetical protein